ncbi:phosphatidylinositol 4-phosphate 5-kinase 9-like [Phalaenopsis equestris]|uniref:phosphatidylinositol 4-phosphate 5-kinase 9-like n=1 Tax=Phalaenopsis equestris TaxID=78828 RepID=UPI0009E415FF|nr:phosphatidylinositol 4-phosphate 5-kinase 9-like [Phalaenopsis equestris]
MLRITASFVAAIRKHKEEMQMQKFSSFLRSSSYRLSTFNEMLLACHSVVFTTCFPLILLTFLMVFYHYLRSGPFSILNIWFLSLASSIILIKSGLFLLLRRKKPVEWFVGDEENPTVFAGASIDNRVGTELYSNGDSYEGELYLGKFNGSGVYDFFERGRYEGDWVDGKCDGYGIERWGKGTRYYGHYRKGLYHGFGVYQFNKSVGYAGEWARGQSNGYGVLRCSDGGCYVGQFEFGVKHGLGVYHFSNGDKYAGAYFGGMAHGFGVYYYANGDCYEGSWQEGVQQGFGMYALRGGGVKSGEWNYGTLKNSLSPAHPQVYSFAQSGRNAAERAILLPTVEDELNRAVSAANRAAAAARVAAVRAVRYREERSKAWHLLTESFRSHVSKFVNLLACSGRGWRFEYIG